MKKLLTLILTLVVGVYAFAGTYSPIYPTILTLDLKKSRPIAEFKIFNTADQRKNYEVIVKDVDNQGTKSILAQYIKIFPQKFSLEAGTNKDIRVMVASFPSELKGKGEYRAALLITGNDTKVADKYVSKDPKAITTSIDLKIDVSMAVYGLSGGETEKVTPVNLTTSADGKNLEFKVKNDGNYSYPIAVTSYDTTGKQIGEPVIRKLIAGYDDVLSFPKAGVATIKVATYSQEARKPGKELGSYPVASLLK